MFPSIDFLLATIAVVVVIICYVLLLAKLKLADEPSKYSEFSEFSKLLQETYEGLPVQRRTESLKKIKEERIKEYLDRRKRKLGDS